MNFVIPPFIHFLVLPYFSRERRKTQRFNKRNPECIRPIPLDRDTECIEVVDIYTPFIAQPDKMYHGLIAFTNTLRAVKAASLYSSQTTNCVVIVPEKSSAHTAEVASLRQRCRIRVHDCWLPSPAYPINVYDCLVYRDYAVLRWPRPLRQSTVVSDADRFQTRAQQQRDCAAIAAAHPMMVHHREPRPAFEPTVFRDDLEGQDTVL